MVGLVSNAVGGCGDDSEGAGGTGAASSATGTQTGTGSGSGSTTSGVGGGPPAADPGAPIVFYTDMISVPAGAYLTLWGKGFGATMTGSSVKLSNTDITAIKSWTDGMIELQIPEGATGGDLVITTPGGASPATPIAVHTGHIYFVASDGDDGFSGTKESASGGDGPFATITRGRDALQPGDVLYLRAGQYVGEDNFDAVLSLYVVPPGSENAPIAIVGYPGEKATIGDATLSRSFSLYNGDEGPSLDYLVIAKLDMKPSCDGIEIINASHGRLVGNEISGASDACANGVVETQGTSGWKVFGNYLHDNGNTKLEHGIYLGGYGSQTDWEIAYNRIENQHGGRAIQLFGHTPNDSISGISIHDNELTDIDRDAIVLGDTDADVLHLSDIRIFDNVIVRGGRCVGAGVRVNNATAADVHVLHNTLVDNGAGNIACDQSEGESGQGLLLEQGTSVELTDNIVVSNAGGAYVDDQVGQGVLSGSNNLWNGAGAPPAFDGAAVTGDPKFAGESDFHLLVGSPAIDAATGSTVTSDHDGIKRPQGSASDIGAYEYFTPN